VAFGRGSGKARSALRGYQDLDVAVYPYESPWWDRLRRTPRYLFSSVLEYLIGVLPLPPKVSLLLHQARGVRFADRSTVFVRPLVQLAPRFPDDLTVGRNVFFDVCSMVLTDRFLPQRREHRFERTRIVIEDNVFLGMGAIVLPGVTLHTGAVVSPGSVVYEDVPPHTLVRGNPARPVTTLPPVDRGPVRPPAAPARPNPGEDEYDENGLSREVYPYEQAFLRTLVKNPLVLLRSFLTYCILTLPIPPRLATFLYAWMGVNFRGWRTSGIVLPIFMDPIHPGGITIGKYSHISNQSLIASHFFDPYQPGFCYRKGRVVIGENVFLGMGVIIAGPVRIGDHCMAAANSVVFREIKDNLGVVGNPARAFSKLPSRKRDYELTVDRDTKFHDDSGKSADIYHFEHRLAAVLRDNPKRILDFLLDYLASVLPLSCRLKASIQRFCGIRIADRSRITLGSLVYLERLAPENLTIGRNVTIQDRVKVLAHYVEPSVEGCYYRTGKVVIEDDVFIGACSVIANNITVGRGAVIMPGTLIASDVPPDTIIGGFPSAVLGKREYVPGA
jgi:acetyltransferase-like isoleucine patch superfamily enzyme